MLDLRVVAYRICMVFALLGLFSGTISGLFGLGGGVFLVPILLSLGFIVHESVAISVIQMVFVSLFGSFLNLRSKFLDLKNGLFLGIGGMIGGSFSGIILNITSPLMLKSVFFIFNIFAFYKFLNKNQKAKKISLSSNARVAVLIFTGAFVGVFASTLGIGGGLLMMPILMRVLGLDTKKIIALSLCFIIFTSLSASFSLYKNGILNEVILKNGAIIGAASIVGVSIGTYFLNKISLKSHRLFLGLIYILSLSLTAYHIVKEFL